MDTKKRKKTIGKRQLEIFQFILSEVQQKGYPPSVREIGAKVGLASSSTVHFHLGVLETLGYIRRDPTKPRAIEILKKLDGNPIEVQKSMINVPIVGQVTAGEPILAFENIDDFFPLPQDFVDKQDVFILRIQGDSMIDAGIFNKDYVLVEKRETATNGEIVVALVDGEEATVKRFFHEGDHIRLQPENTTMSPIILNNVAILGKVIGLIRRIP